MRLLVLTNFYPPLALGGYELICQQHVEWLRGRGHHVTVLTSSYGVDGTATGDDVVRRLDLHWRDFEHQTPGWWRLLYGERRQRRLLERVIRDGRPDAALVWGMAAISKSLLAVLGAEGVRTVAVVEEEWPIWDIESDAWLSFWSAHLGRRLRSLGGPLRRLAAAAVAPVDVRPALGHIQPIYASHDLLQHVEAAREEWRGKGRVALNGISSQMFATRDPDEPLSRPLRLLYAGRVEARKGVRTAIEALAGLTRGGTSAVLTVAGWRHPAYTEELEKTAGELDVAPLVHWREVIPREAMPQLYRQHDVLLFPTIWREPFGLVPLEAMACGCLVIATGTGGSAEYLRNGENALLFPPQDDGAIAERVKELAANPTLVRRLRLGGSQTAARHRFDDFALAIEGALTEDGLALVSPG
jgi:glycosyltransferase involved in cell wall biosynthesis